MTVEPLADSTVVIVGEIPAADFERFRPTAIERLNQTVKLDGFRPGRAPEPVLLARLGENKILETMAELALRERYPVILETNKIDAIGRPEIAITKLASGNPLGFKITTAVYPRFTLPDYRRSAAAIFHEVSPEEDKASPSEEGEAFSTETATGTRQKQRVAFLDQMIETAAIVIPTVLREAELDKMTAEMKMEIERLGLKFDDYLKHLKKSVSDLRQEWQTQAEKRVRSVLILDGIAQTEKIAAPPAAVEEETKRLLELHPEVSASWRTEQAKAYVSHRLATEEVWKFLEKGARI